MSKERERLLNLLAEKTFRYSQTPFKLASGGESNYYFDCKMTALYPEGLKLIGMLAYELIKDVDADGIGGLTLGADPIVLATSLCAHENGKLLYPLIVRKESKSHGTQKYIEGHGDLVKKVIAVDDVITTGGSTIKAIERFREAGIEVVKTIVLIDREEMNGRQNIESLGVNVDSLFKKSDFDKFIPKN